MDDRRIIEAAVERILYPIVKLLIDCGVTEAHFAKVARRTYAKVAAQKLEVEVDEQKKKAFELQQSMQQDGKSTEVIEAAIAGVVKTPRVTNTRIAMLTGINRKEVPALLAERLEDQGSDDEWYRHRCGKVLSDWWRSVEFTDSKGQPLELAESREEALANGEDVSFEKLVKEGGRDLSYHALLDELLATKCVQRLDNGRIRVLSKRYERNGLSPQSLTEAADKLYHLAETINAKLRGSEQIDEGVAFSISVKGGKRAALLMNKLRRGMKTFLNSSQSSIKDYEVDGDSAEETVRVGIGCYVFQGDEMAESAHFAKSSSAEKKVSNE